MKLRSLFYTFAVVVASVALPKAAHAAGGGGLPWDQPLATLWQNLTGPTAFGISMVAGFAAVAGLVFAQELNGWSRGALITVMGMSFLCGIATFASAIGITVAGATF